MKRWNILILAVLLLLLCGCVAHPVEDVIGGADGPTSILVEDAGNGETDDAAESVILTCRVVKEEDGTLLLAEFEGSGIYTLAAAGIPVFWDEGAIGAAEKEMEEGALIDITYCGEVAESWPMIPGGVTEIRVRADGFDDMCEMYLEVLEDLWEEDAGLNSGATDLSVDLSKTSLSESEKAAVRWAFGNECGISDMLDLTLEELGEEGYLTKEETGFTHWEDGVYLAIEETPPEGVYHGLVPVQFDAWKWRSSLGAYFFSECTSVQSALGQWGDYQVGAHMIS